MKTKVAFSPEVRSYPMDIRLCVIVIHVMLYIHRQVNGLKLGLNELSNFSDCGVYSLWRKLKAFN